MAEAAHCFLNMVSLYVYMVINFVFVQHYACYLASLQVREGNLKGSLGYVRNDTYGHI
jgi:hypothetical protein